MEEKKGGREAGKKIKEWKMKEREREGGIKGQRQKDEKER